MSGGGLLSSNQITFHKELNNINESTFISGFSNVNQWYNSEMNPKHPRIITIFGKSHQSLNEFDTCNIKSKSYDRRAIPRENKNNLDIFGLDD